MIRDRLFILAVPLACIAVTFTLVPGFAYTIPVKWAAYCLCAGILTICTCLFRCPIHTSFRFPPQCVITASSQMFRFLYPDISDKKVRYAIAAFVAAASVGLFAGAWRNGLLLLQSTAAVVFCAGVLLAFCAYRFYPQTRSDQTLTAVLLAAGAAVVSLAGLIQIGRAIIRGARNWEFAATTFTGNANWTAVFCGACAVFLLPWLRRQISCSTGVYVFFVIATLLSLLAVVLSLSVGALVATLCGIGVQGVCSQKKLSYRFLISMVVLVSVMSGAIFYGLSTGDRVNGRLFLVRTAGVQFVRSPVLGNGLSSYPALYAQSASRLINGDPHAWFPRHTIRFAHNDYVQTLCETGLVGVAVLLVLLAFLLFISLRSLVPFVRGAAGMLTVFCVTMSVDSVLKIPSSAALFALCCGWICAFFNARGTSLRVDAPERTNTLMMIVLCILGVICLLNGLRMAGGVYLWNEGTRHGYNSTLLTRASQLLPENGDVHSVLSRAYASTGNDGPACRSAAAALKYRFAVQDAYRKAALCSQDDTFLQQCAGWSDLARQFPGLVRPWYEMSLLYRKHGDVMAARACCDTLLSITPVSEYAAAIQKQGILQCRAWVDQ